MKSILEEAANHQISSIYLDGAWFWWKYLYRSTMRKDKTPKVKKVDSIYVMKVVLLRCIAVETSFTMSILNNANSLKRQMRLGAQWWRWDCSSTSCNKNTVNKTHPFDWIALIWSLQWRQGWYLSEFPNSAKMLHFKLNPERTYRCEDPNPTPTKPEQPTKPNSKHVKECY